MSNEKEIIKIWAEKHLLVPLDIFSAIIEVAKGHTQDVMEYNDIVGEECVYRCGYNTDYRLEKKTEVHSSKCPITITRRYLIEHDIPMKRYLVTYTVGLEMRWSNYQSDSFTRNCTEVHLSIFDFDYEAEKSRIVRDMESHYTTETRKCFATIQAIEVDISTLT